MYQILQTKPGRDVTVVGGHPWLFSGALAAVPDDLPNGSPVSVANPAGEIFATGLYSRKSMIAVRVCEFREAVLDETWLRDKIKAADNRRRLFGLGTNTDNGYRVVFGESDGLPGLVVDRYNDVLVMQLSMVGMDLLRDTVVACLVELFKPTAIFERSDLPSRKDEGLQPETGLRHGTLPEQVVFNRQGRKYIATAANAPICFRTPARPGWRRCRVARQVCSLSIHRSRRLISVGRSLTLTVSRPNGTSLRMPMCSSGSAAAKSRTWT